MKKLFTALCFISVFLVIANIQISAQEIIYGCVSTRDGKLRIVRGPEECHPKKETDIFWNQTGSQGPPGEKGEKGDPGDPGGTKAYSATDEYLGLVTDLHVVSYSQDVPCTVAVFVEDLQRFLHIKENTGENLYTPNFQSADPFFYYNDTLCTGTPHIYYRDGITYNILTNFFLVSGNETAKHFKVVGVVDDDREMLAKYTYSGGCEELGGSQTIDGGYILEEVTLSFTYPVDIPLVIK